MKLQAGLSWKFLREKSWKLIDAYLNPKRLGRPRLSIDYERKAESEEAWIKIAMMAIGLRRLEKA